MLVQLTARRGIAIHPCRCEFTLLTAVPDRPAGVHELCPTLRLDDDAIETIGSVKEVETAVGLMRTSVGGWVTVDIRRGRTRAVLVLDLADHLVQRWLADAESDGPIVGLLAARAARVVRVPMLDIIAALRKRAATALPAGPVEQRALVARLLNHLGAEAGDPEDRGLEDGGQSLYIALPPRFSVSGTLGTASAVSMLH